MAKWLKLYVLCSFYTSPDLCCHTTFRSPKFAVNNDYVVSIMGSTETTTSYHAIKRSDEVSR